MALLAEELVEEWLRRQGYFTIRGIRLGVQEIDLLAVRSIAGVLDARHVEVQASVNPVNYLTPLTPVLQKAKGVSSTSQVPRTPADVTACVDRWVQRKFHHPLKKALRNRLIPGVEWSFELVVHKAKHEDEIAKIAEYVKVHRLPSVMTDLHGGGAVVAGAAGTDFVHLAGLSILT